MKLLEEFLKSELKLDPEKYSEKFKLYGKLLLEKNESINLVSRKTVSIENHILNSVFFLKRYKIKKDCSLIDLGTGGGFPGIPVKILFPDIFITLLDSIKKKTTALNEIVTDMNLANTEVICGRAEELSGTGFYRNKFDIVISKAVAPVLNLFNWGKDFLKPGGEILCIKGGDISKEISELRNLKKPPESEVINYEFNEKYKIEDKKLIVIKNVF